MTRQWQLHIEDLFQLSSGDFVFVGSMTFRENVTFGEVGPCELCIDDEPVAHFDNMCMRMPSGDKWSLQTSEPPPADLKSKLIKHRVLLRALD